MSLLTQASPKNVYGYSPTHIFCTGFMARFFKLPFGNDYEFSREFYDDLYSRPDIIGLVTQVTRSKIDEEYLCDNVVSPNTIYGFPMPTSTYTVELSGYFYADFSGIYEFFVVSGDGWSFSLGNSEGCVDDAPQDVPQRVDYYKDDGICASENSPEPGRRLEYNLRAGIYYPIKIITVHRKYGRAFSNGFIRPDGAYHSDIAPRVCQVAMGRSEKIPSIWESTS